MSNENEEMTEERDDVSPGESLLPRLTSHALEYHLAARRKTSIRSARANVWAIPLRLAIGSGSQFIPKADKRFILGRSSIQQRKKQIEISRSRDTNNRQTCG